MSLEAFFSWQERQDERYELVGGVPLRLMAGATNAHDRIVVNLIVQLGNQLRGTGCRPFTGDGSVETYPGQIRRPDAGVDCGQFVPNGFRASEPRLVVEVLSPSTRDFDTYAKVEEYKAVATIDYVVLIEPNAPEAVMWARDGDGWRVERADGIDATLAMPSLKVSLALADLYEGVAFPAGPRLAFGRLPDGRT
jgi:Uma2 family endonuclease